jgi:hypothetical protein
MPGWHQCASHSRDRLFAALCCLSSVCSHRCIVTRRCTASRLPRLSRLLFRAFAVSRFVCSQRSRPAGTALRASFAIQTPVSRLPFRAFAVSRFVCSQRSRPAGTALRASFAIQTPLSRLPFRAFPFAPSRFRFVFFVMFRVFRDPNARAKPSRRDGFTRVFRDPNARFAPSLSRLPFRAFAVSFRVFRDVSRLSRSKRPFRVFRDPNARAKPSRRDGFTRVFRDPNARSRSKRCSHEIQAVTSIGYTTDRPGRLASSGASSTLQRMTRDGNDLPTHGGCGGKRRPA